MSATLNDMVQSGYSRNQNKLQVDANTKFLETLEIKNNVQEKQLAEQVGNLEKQVANGADRKALADEYTQVDQQLDQLAEQKQSVYQQKVDNHQAAIDATVADDAHHAQQMESFEQDISALEESTTNGEAELNELNTALANTDKEKEREKAQALEQQINAKEQQVVADQKTLNTKQKQSALAENIANEQSAENAQRVEQACPNKCSATRIEIKTNNTKRKVTLESTAGSKTLQVISQSLKATERGHVEPGVRVIEAVLEGECKKGKTNVSTLSAQANVHERDGSAENCPVMTIKQDETNIILPGTANAPLKFNAYCPDPAAEFFSIVNWYDLYKKIFFPKENPFHKTYTIQTQSCEGSAAPALIVEAYPKSKLDFSIAVQYNPAKTAESSGESLDKANEEKIISSDAEQESGHKVLEVGAWKLEAELKGYVDQFDFAPKIKDIELADMFKGMRESVEAFVGFFEMVLASSESNLGVEAGDDAGSKNLVMGKTLARLGQTTTDEKGNIIEASSTSGIGHFKLNYPKLALAISTENTETEKSLELDTAWSVALKADPLIGVKGTIDVLAVLLNLAANALLPGCPALISALEASADQGSSFLALFRKIARSYNKNLADKAKNDEDIKDRAFYAALGVSLELEVGANLGCAGQWKKDFGTPDPIIQPDPKDNKLGFDLSGALTSTMDIQLKGMVYGKAHGKALGFKLEFEAGMYVLVGSAKEVGAAKVEFKFEAGIVDGEPKVVGGVEWSGLAILTATYTKKTFESVADDEVEDDKTSDGSFRKKKVKPSAIGEEVQFDFDRRWTLIPPGNYPSGSEITLDQYAKL